MNKLNSIIDDSLRDARIRPCPLRFIELRFNARHRAKASGMERYYRVAERAFRKPETAKKTLQYLLTNLSAMICENVYIGHAISGRNLNVPASRTALQSLYDNILSDRHIIDMPSVGTASGVEQFRKSDNAVLREAKTAKLYSWHKDIMRDANISGCSGAFSCAGLFQYAVLWKPNRPHAHAGDPTAICSKLLSQYVYPIEEARQKESSCRAEASPYFENNIEYCRELTEFVFKLRNDIVHHNFITPIDSTSLGRRFRLAVKDYFPDKYNYYQHECLACISMTLAMPYVVSCLLNGPQLAFRADWLTVCPPLWTRWKGQFPEYPVVDPILGGQLKSYIPKQHEKSQCYNRLQKMSAIVYSLRYVFRVALQFACLLLIVVCVRAAVHHWRGNGINDSSASDEILSYVESMNNYDRSLLLKERRKFLLKHPEFYNERRENELSRRYSNEHWPETSFTRTLLHIGTPRWLHGGRSTSPVTGTHATETDLSDKSNSN